MHTQKLLATILTCLHLLCAASVGYGEETAQGKRHARMRKLASSIRVYVDDEAKQLAKLNKDPIFVWSNPQRDAIGGMAFLWTHLGRPHATVGIWTYDDTEATDSYELQSLADHAFRSNQSIWPTDTNGVVYKQLDTNLKPSKSKPVRLGQMRQLVRKNFSATLHPGEKRADKLRFLPTPVYRYKELPPGVIDGAVFSFALGTDPEVFVIIEARSAAGKKNWYFAIGSQSSEPTQASLRDKVVWESRKTSRETFRMVLRRP